MPYACCVRGAAAADSPVPCSSPAPHHERCLLGEVGTRLAWLCSSALAGPRRPLTKNHLQKRRAKGGRGELCSVTAGSSALLGLLSKKMSKCFFCMVFASSDMGHGLLPCIACLASPDGFTFPSALQLGVFLTPTPCGFCLFILFLNLFFIF